MSDEGLPVPFKSYLVYVVTILYYFIYIYVCVCVCARNKTERFTPLDQSYICNWFGRDVLSSVVQQDTVDMYFGGVWFKSHQRHWLT
jgi:hypothetical protein